MSNGFVCAMGIGIVFLGLICLVFICWLMGLICKSRDKKPKAEVKEEIPNKSEMLAAISAVIAEELGKDVSAIRILSFKKM